MGSFSVQAYVMSQTEVKSPKILRRSRRGATQKGSASKKGWNTEREAAYGRLVQSLQVAGYVVRREELKRGHCWRVMSGECRSLQNRYIFIDSRLNAEEQVAFLSSKVAEINPCDQAA